MEISLDNFLDGKIKIYQPKNGYRAGLDAILLASSLKVFNKCKILDIGSGTGVISLFIASKYKNVEIVGIEKNFKYYSLSKKSLKINKLKSKIKFLHKDFKSIVNMKSDIIVSNPPWFKKNSTYKSKNSLLNDAKIESIKLDLWIKKVLINLNSKGEYYTIFPYRRIKEIINILKIHFKSVEVYPLSSFKNKPPDKAIIFAKRSGKECSCHEYDSIIIHKKDKRFMKNIDGILKKGNSLSLA
tara:strand:- start:1475 stop:2200 length:726 start_codon:yes stop_codon:yes gene_type:complete